MTSRKGGKLFAMRKNAPPFNISHFSINVDDMDRAQAFYAAVFGWKFQPWGPPGFFLIDNGGEGIHGAIQQRREPISGSGIRGYECTISVNDVDETVKLIEANGGTIHFTNTHIPTVGEIASFFDTEGNYACIAKYDE